MPPRLPLNSLLLLEEQWDLFLAALVTTARTVLPPQNSFLSSHFDPCNNPMTQVLVPFYKGRQLGPESSDHLLKVT